jgi:hypothetical protein
MKYRRKDHPETWVKRHFTEDTKVVRQRLTDKVFSLQRFRKYYAVTFKEEPGATYYLTLPFYVPLSLHRYIYVTRPYRPAGPHGPG